MPKSSQSARHQWPSSGQPFSRSEPERCVNCNLLSRAVAAKPYEHGPQRYYWRYGEGPVEQLARNPGQCAHSTEVRRAA